MSEVSTTTAISEFDQATAVQPRHELGLDGTSTYGAEVSGVWGVGPKPNGGYLLSIAGRAAGEALASAGIDHRVPLAATAHYLRAPDAGPAEVHVDILRPGRNASQVRAVIHQNGKPCVDATFTMGTLPDTDTDTAAAVAWSALPPYPVAPIEDCPRIPPTPPGGQFVVSIMERADLRLDPATMAFATGNPQGRGNLAGWITFADGRPADPLSLLLFADSLPPATLDVADAGWVPTLSLTAYVRATPAPGPLRIRQRAQVVDHGRVDEVCEIWDSTGRLVAQATQLAGIRFADDAAIVPYPD